MKPYKACPPLHTIQRVRNILSELDIFTTEIHLGLNGAYYSCRVVIDNNNLGIINIGTNGKGMSKEYALASAYGELMERIQNRLLFRSMYFATSDALANNPLLQELKVNPAYVDLILEFRYYPDEQKVELKGKDALLKYVKKYLSRIHREEYIEYLEDTVYTLIEAPFYDVFGNSTEYLPVELIRMSAGSTGLCAGNTPIEAILQGINEIFERYVLQCIYLHRITPPVIPISYFKNTQVILALERLSKQQGINYEIRDCSLGEGYPVIGLLLIDRKNNTYSFRLGADYNPEIALQRCYTEAFQGVNRAGHSFTPIMFDDEDVDYKEEFNRSVKDGSGKFPPEIFGSVPSYSFDGIRREVFDTEKQEYEYYKSFINSKGFSLYIRDNSFLGFPSYHIFIPNLSVVSPCLFNHYELLDKVNTKRYKIPYEYRIKSLTDDELLLFASELEEQRSKQIELYPYYTGAYNKINRKLLLALIYFKTNCLEKAYLYMKGFLLQMQADKIKIEMYYYALRDYFYWMHRTDHSEVKTISVLSKIYGEFLAKEIIEDMHSRESVFVNFRFPNCFDCDHCQVADECRFREILLIDKIIQKAFQKNVRNQSEMEML